ncbi:hypothetical protein [Microcoleus sp. bin38.metabat.b11b12b14.051]|uniref:hypothetical protein n=1 Tax=Microcoleus sp. bin38.metabat.b11b12b14.051 TaxID=2742709 RepID=UPI0025FF8FD5|nr:hypothetical protein [Microcoleus sp. bin38.metabat.b11b12b14.051]
MEKRLLLGYHTHSGDEVFALIKRKMVLVFRKPKIRAIAGLAPLLKASFSMLYFGR